VETIERFKPKAIVTLGNSALRWFTGQWGIEKLRGYIFDSEWGPVVPTYHPSYIQRGKWYLARVVESDLLKAVQVAREGRDCFHKPKTYITRPAIEEAYNFFQRWVDAGRPPLAFDIETPMGSDTKDEEMTFEEDSSYTILMVSFAFEPYKAISMPWMPPFIDVAKALLGQATTSLVWNAPFDVPRLAANGVEFGGQVVDCMIMWHWLEPSLPMGLKFVAPFLCPDMDAWALGKDEDFAAYNCGDSDVLLRAYLEIRERLVAQGRMDIFQRHFLDLGVVLGKMTNRGIKVDREARNTSRKGFEAEKAIKVEQAKAMAPLAVCPHHPKAGYKKDEEGLKKIGSWEEGRMRQIDVEISEDEYMKEVNRVTKKRLKEMEKAKKKAKKQKELPI
jgi:hypothetical protein